MTPFGCDALVVGVILGAASMLSVGPNTYLLVREGLVRGRVGLVATLVWSSEFIMLATAFVLSDAITTGLTPLRSALTWLGLAAVSWFAVMSLRAAGRSGGRSRLGVEGETVEACLRRFLMIVWLNPLAYVELLLIPSSMCQTFKEPHLRLQFMVGMTAMAALSCYGYAFGAGRCASLFRHRRSLQVFDLTSGLLLASIAAFMAAGLVSHTD